MSSCSRCQFTIVVFLLALFAGIVSGTAKDLSTMDESIFGKVASSRSLEIDGLKSFQVAGGRIIVWISKGDPAVTSLEAYDIETLKRIWSVETPITYLEVSSGDSPVIMTIALHNEYSAPFPVYDLDGNLLFRKVLEGTLNVSPSGTYFYSGLNLITSEGKFQVFNRTGELILEPYPDSREMWAAHAVTDSIVCYINSNEIRFLSVFDGVLIASLPIPQEAHLDMPEFMAMLRASNSTGQMMISLGLGQVYYITPDLKFGWQFAPNVRTNFFDAQFVCDGDFVAIYVKVPNMGPRLHLVRVADGITIWSEDIEPTNFSGRQTFLQGTGLDNSVTAVIPLTGYHAFGRIDKFTTTYHFLIDPVDGKIVNQENYEGIVIPLNPDGLQYTLNVIESRKNAIAIQSWTESEK